MVIKFYLTSENYGCFSNFSLDQITIDELIWPTSEHYFQAQKFPHDPHYQRRIRSAPTPNYVADLGRDRRHRLRSDWDSVKDDYMRFIVLQKFAQNQEICKTLLCTNNERIVEASPSDRYWGEGSDGRGRNMLGAILMETRIQLKNQGGYLGGSDVATSIPKYIATNNPNPAYKYQETLLRRLRLVS